MEARRTRLSCNELCIKDVSEELGLSRVIIRGIVSSQFEYVKNMIESNTYDSVRLGYLGVFRCKVKEVQILNYLRGMTKEQQEVFKQQVRAGQFKIKYDEPQ